MHCGMFRNLGTLGQAATAAHVPVGRSATTSARAAARPRSLAPAVLVVVALQTPLLAACSGGSPEPGGQSPHPPVSSSAKPRAVHGPFFPDCGGVSDQTVGQLTGLPDLVNTARNSVGCQWVVGSGTAGPLVSFAWFRGSLIGRERAAEDRMRTRVDDINIDGHTGFIAVASDPRLGDRLCDVGIQFQDDFFEWSIQFTRKPFPNPCDIATQLSRRSIAAGQ
jgi:hypothetical protein